MFVVLSVKAANGAAKGMSEAQGHDEHCWGLTSGCSAGDTNLLTRQLLHERLSSAC